MDFDEFMKVFLDEKQVLDKARNQFHRDIRSASDKLRLEEVISMIEFTDSDCSRNEDVIYKNVKMIRVDLADGFNIIIGERVLNLRYYDEQIAEFHEQKISDFYRELHSKINNYVEAHPLPF